MCHPYVQLWPGLGCFANFIGLFSFHGSFSSCLLASKHLRFGAAARYHEQFSLGDFPLFLGGDLTCIEALRQQCCNRHIDHVLQMRSQSTISPCHALVAIVLVPL